MIVLLLLLVSWFLLFLEGKDLTALGFNAPRARIIQCAVGFLAAGAVVVIQQLTASAASGVPWVVNSDLSTALVFHVLRLNIISVLYEELLFRGYLLYQLIRWLGRRRAVVLGGAAFGIYHWFSYGVLGQPVPMIWVFFLTGGFGLMLAAAFAKTRSLAAPVGLHLGWNLVAYLGFSHGPFGPGIFVPANASEMAVPGVAGVAINLGIPFVLILGTLVYLLHATVETGALKIKVFVTPAP